MTIEPLQRDFIKYNILSVFVCLLVDGVARRPVPPPGWVKYVHPEGVRYFYNDKEVRFFNRMPSSYSNMTQKVYTDADLFDPEILHQATEHIATIQNCLSNNHVHLSDSIVLVLDVYYAEAEGEEEQDKPKAKNSNKFIQTIYHLADHENRVVFFLDNFEASDLRGCYEIQNVTSETHLRKNFYLKYLLLNL